MDIEMMSEQEKSVRLAKVIGWIRPAGNEFKMGTWVIDVPNWSRWENHYWRVEPKDLPDFNLYRAPMEIAWQVLNWAIKDDLFAYSPFLSWLETWPLFLAAQKPDRAQAILLDKILESALELIAA